MPSASQDGFIEFVRNCGDAIRLKTAARRAALFHGGARCKIDRQRFSLAPGREVVECQDCTELLEQVLMDLYAEAMAKGSETPGAYARAFVEKRIEDSIRKLWGRRGLVERPARWVQSSTLNRALTPVQVELLVAMAFFVRHPADPLINGGWPYERWATDHDGRLSPRDLRDAIDREIPARVKAISPAWARKYEDNIEAPYAHKQQAQLEHAAPEDDAGSPGMPPAGTPGETHDATATAPGSGPRGEAGDDGPAWYDDLVHSTVARVESTGVDPVAALAAELASLADDQPGSPLGAMLHQRLGDFGADSDGAVSRWLEAMLAAESARSDDEASDKPFTDLLAEITDLPDSKV